MSDLFGSDFMTIVDEDGTEYELEVLSTLEYNGATYLAVIPAGNEEENYQIEILKSVEEEDGESILCAIDLEAGALTLPLGVPLCILTFIIFSFEWRKT